MEKFRNIAGTDFYYSDALHDRLEAMHVQIRDMWNQGELDPQLLLQRHRQSKVDELYHSNRIEGNSLTYGDSRIVVEDNEAVAGKPTRDQIEARNLATALDFVHEFAIDEDRPVTQNLVRQIHNLILNDLQEDAGKYRHTPVEITGSKHTIVDAFLVPQEMTRFSDFVAHSFSKESQDPDLPLLLAVAAHTWLVHIHPFTDGNGRTARALMTLILMRKGYFPCIITEDDRSRYIDAVEYSRDSSDLTALLELALENIELSVENFDWLRSVSARLEHSNLEAVREEYSVWRNAMDFLKAQFKHTVDNFNSITTLANIYWKSTEYGSLGIEKYVAIRNHQRARKTWFFGIEMNSGHVRKRYVLFFASADSRTASRSPVVLVVAKNTEQGYERLDKLSEHGIRVPDIFHIGFDVQTRRFVAVGRRGMRERNPASLVKQFFEEVVERDFGT